MEKTNQTIANQAEASENNYRYFRSDDITENEKIYRFHESEIKNRYNCAGFFKKIDDEYEEIDIEDEWLPADSEVYYQDGDEYYLADIASDTVDSAEVYEYFDGAQYRTLTLLKSDFSYTGYEEITEEFENYDAEKQVFHTDDNPWEGHSLVIFNRKVYKEEKSQAMNYINGIIEMGDIEDYVDYEESSYTKDGTEVYPIYWFGNHGMEGKSSREFSGKWLVDGTVTDEYDIDLEG